MRRRGTRRYGGRAEEDTTEEMNFERGGKIEYFGVQKRRMIGSAWSSQL